MNGKLIKENLKQQGREFRETFVVQNMIVKRNIDEKFIVLTKNTQKISNGNPLLYIIRSDLKVPTEIAKSYYLRKTLGFQIHAGQILKNIKI